MNRTIVGLKVSRAAKLIFRIRIRDLLKRAYVIPLNAQAIPNPLDLEKLTQMDKHEVSKHECNIAKNAKVDPDEIIVHLQSIAIKLYERFDETIGKRDKPMLIRHNDDSVGGIDAESPFAISPHSIRRLYVFSSESVVGKVAEIAEQIFKVKNHYLPKKKSR